MIILDGTRTFADIPAAYHEEIKVYIVANFTLAQVDAAYERGSLKETQWQELIVITPKA